MFKNVLNRLHDPLLKILSTKFLGITFFALMFAILIMPTAYVHSLINTNNNSLIFEDNFNNENYQFGDYNYQSLKNWNVLDGSIDLVGNGFHDLIPDNGLYLDLDGSTQNGGKIETKNALDLQPGSIDLLFDLAGSQREMEETDAGPNTVTVQLGDLYNENFTMGGLVPFQSIERTITVNEPSSGKLSFDQSGSDERGLLLDNIRLYYNPINKTNFD